jgi:hypothetical protein
VGFVAITFCVASQRVFIVVSVYFVIDSVRKLLGTWIYPRARPCVCVCLCVCMCVCVCVCVILTFNVSRSGRCDNNGNLPLIYTASQPRKPQLESTLRSLNTAQRELPKMPSGYVIRSKVYLVGSGCQ